MPGKIPQITPTGAQSYSSSIQLAIFSEVYYPKGWNAYVDNESTEYFRANYVLRAMVIPKGEHIVEFKFQPKSYSIGTKVSYASSILLILAFVAFILNEFRKQKIGKPSKNITPLI